MGIIRSTEQRLQDAMRENEALRAENARLQADLAYVAMMADVELDEEDGSHE